jgi:hypothetical protein
VEILTSMAYIRGTEHQQGSTKARRIEPEPLLKAITRRVVQLSHGKFRFSDIFMSVAKSALSKEEALDEGAEFIVNGERYHVLAASPTSQTWEFVIRRRSPYV